MAEPVACRFCTHRLNVHVEVAEGGAYLCAAPDCGCKIDNNRLVLGHKRIIDPEPPVKRRLLSDNSCPSCGTILDDGTQVVENGEVLDNVVFGGVHAGTHLPRDGDVSICFNCVSVNVFTGFGLGQRLPTDQEREEFLADDRIVTFMAMMLSAKVDS